jgi:HAD superfamily hydrolase (TIGR01509 family)
MYPIPFNFEAAIFDCDGTLVESRECWRFAFSRVLGEAVPDDVMVELAGASTRTAAWRLGEISGRQITPAEISDGLMEAPVRRPLEPLDGVEDVLEFLRVGGLPMGVATNGPRDFVESILGERLLSFFAVVVASEELGSLHDKPKPFVYRRACQLLGVLPTSAVAFEDSDVGAESANAAGLSLVFVNAGQHDPPEVAHNLFLNSLQDRRLREFLTAVAPARVEASE